MIEAARDYAGLLAYLERVAPYRFGYRGRETHDCVRFGLGGVLAQGLPRPRGLPSWSSQRQAEALLVTRGGLIAAVDSIYTRIPASLAQRGDLVAVEGPDQPGLGLVEGERLVFPTRPSGLVRAPLSVAVAAWSVTWPKP